MDLNLDAWAAWPPRALADRLADVGAPWCVAAGWALDLFRGAQSRPHGDLEIAVPEGSFDDIAGCFPELEFWVADDGKLYAPTPETLKLGHQTWAWEPAARRWRFDVFREPHDDDVWICRRDGRIRAPYAEIIEHTPDGVPYLVPEIALLFKAKRLRAKDRADFDATLPLLDGRRRSRLAGLLDLVHPDHPWRAALAGPVGPLG
jgi:hypothetical protein